MNTVVVAGMGYVGLPLAMQAVTAGYHVVGYDTDPSRVKQLEACDSYIEDVPGDQLAGAISAGAFRATCEPDACSGFDVAVIAVPTPLRDGLPDLHSVEAVSRTLAGYLRPGTTVVVESTSYPGTTEESVRAWLEEGSGLVAGPDFHLGYSPERIDPGNKTWTLATTPKIVSGIDKKSLAAIDRFYQSMVDKTVPVSSPRVAELAKLLENTFRHVNIALVNELAMVAKGLGLDVWEAIDAASTKPFGFMRFTPGPGVGGHCLPVDPSYLSWRVERMLGQSFRFVELANDINSHMPDYVVHRLTRALNDQGRPVHGSQILLLGLAYKKNTGDARESPAVRVARLLSDMGALVRAADPHVVENMPAELPVARVEPTAREVSGADAVVLLTDHDAFDTGLITSTARYVLDCRKVLSGPNVETLLQVGEMRAICVAGARPNYMKVKPVMDALEAEGVQVVLVHTGQHYDHAMNGVFFEDLGIRSPDHFLGAGSGTQATQTARTMTAFEPVVAQVAPDIVVVVGDVNSTMACALVTAKSGALLAHVEAGLRSRDWSMPEEVNRVVTDRVSDYLFAPSPDAVANLEAEGYRDDQIHLVGNVMVDTLLANLGRAASRGTLSRLGLEPGRFGLVTLHRPANVDNPEVLGMLLPALAEIARSCPLVLPAHPRTAERLTGTEPPERLRIIPPAGYLDFIALEASARLVLTDSGGVQEETTVLGVPCLTLRDNTERPVTVIEGTNQLTGRDPARIVAAARQVLDCPPPPRCPALWDGHAGERIAKILLTGNQAWPRVRPTGIPADCVPTALRGPEPEPVELAIPPSALPP